ncbi:hypothetical protein [Streptomyces djakartensis]|uniref:hypothetical protein n=1 Tax=Streptomyces djakartensis TaxID=68193 RepID=UPI0034DE869E
MTGFRAGRAAVRPAVRARRARGRNGRAPLRARREAVHTLRQAACAPVGAFTDRLSGVSRGV